MRRRFTASNYTLFLFELHEAFVLCGVAHCFFDNTRLSLNAASLHCFELHSTRLLVVNSLALMVNPPTPLMGISNPGF